MVKSGVARQFVVMFSSSMSDFGLIHRRITCQPIRI